jgi:hypothetical protein
MNRNGFVGWRNRLGLRGNFGVASGSSASLLTLVAHLLLTLNTVGPARAEGGSHTFLNGSAPRPFYVFAHNPNTVHDAEVALQAGANALEPDVTIAEPDTANPSCGTDVLVDWDSSSPNRDGLCSDTRFVDWLKGVHNLAIQYPGLALIAFDIKSPAAKAKYGVPIRDAVRNYLNTDGVNINVIFSVATQSDGGVFANILGDLRPREGVQIDAEDDPAGVVNYFPDTVTNIGYGDGTVFQGPNLPRAIDRAAFLRASAGYPKVVTYVYTLNHVTSMHSFIYSGVDGIIPDAFGVQASGDPSYITTLLNVVNEHPEIRLATRDDNPFMPALQSYGLEVSTSDDTFSGTDANLTFTLLGCRGTATGTVDAGEVLDPIYDSGRMRDGQFDWLTIPSQNLGKLSKITVHNDGTGDAPGWKFVDIGISSARWLGPDFGGTRQYNAHYDAFLDGGHTVTLDLTPNFAEPLPTIQCPASITVANTPGQCSAPASYSPAVSGMCEDVTAVSSPPSGSIFPVGMSTVSSYAQSAAGPRSDACEFKVTVNDTEKPTISCLTPKLECTSPAGAVVAKLIDKASDNCGIASQGCTPGEGSTFPLGSDSFTCIATDGSNNSSSCSSKVTVVDTTPPVINSIVSNPSTLWPPNHKLVPISIAAIATDVCDAAPTCQIVSVTANEPVLGPGSGNTTPDWIISDSRPKTSPATLGVQLRSERAGGGTGRVYSINVSCSDASGNTASGLTTVTVAHDQGH